MITPFDPKQKTPPLEELPGCIFCKKQLTKYDDGVARFVAGGWRVWHNMDCVRYETAKEKRTAKRQPWWKKK